MKQKSVLFVCLGNICRSPVAEGCFRQVLKERNLTHAFTHDSAGTGDWHRGEAPDPRSQKSALEQGVDISDLRARQITAADFDRFDHIVVMDESNLKNVVALAKSDEHRKKITKLLGWNKKHANACVPDPYYGTKKDFDHVFNLCREACGSLVEALLLKG